MSSRRPSLIYEVCARFDELKAIGVSRHEGKRTMRATAKAQGIIFSPQAISTGHIHSDKTLEIYKAVALRYAHWARDTHGICRLADLDAAAEWLVALYLELHRDAGDSAYTLTTTRAALRMFYRPAYPADEREARVRALGATVALPRRRRAAITRSRHAVAMDDAIALERYVAIIQFCCATGVRRRELEALVVGDIRANLDGSLVVDIRNGKGGKRRQAPVLPALEECVVRVVADRPPGEHLVERVPARLDVQSYRRLYAQGLYCEGGRRTLPPGEGRLPRGAVDRERALYVSRALGHERSDVTVRHYLR